MSNVGGIEESKKPVVPKPRVFIDADVLIAGSSSTTGASHIILHLSDLTIIEGLISQQVSVEAERNLQDKLPETLPIFRKLIDSAVEAVSDPTASEIAPFIDQAPIISWLCNHILLNNPHCVFFGIAKFSLMNYRGKLIPMMYPS